jgi:hypothetical protein
VIQLSGDAFHWPFTLIKSRTQFPKPNQPPPLGHVCPSNARKLQTFLTIGGLDSRAFTESRGLTATARNSDDLNTSAVSLSSSPS